MSHSECCCNPLLLLLLLLLRLLLPQYLWPGLRLCACLTQGARGARPRIGRLGTSCV